MTVYALASAIVTPNAGEIGCVSTGGGSDEEDEDGLREENPLFSGTKEQWMDFEECLKAAADADDKEGLRSAVLKWSMTMIRQDLPGYRFESPLLSYCAMVAVNRISMGWKVPGSFNSPLPVGSATGILCSSNTNTLDEILRRLCRRWKRQERSTTSGIVHNWRLMLFNLGKKEVSSKATTRSLEGSEVGYQGTTTSMEQIPRLYHRTQQGVRLIMDRDLVLGAAYPLRMSGTVLQEAEHRHKLNWWLSRKDEMLRGHHELLIKHVRTTLPLREALGHPVD
ncbi:hypothetical protein G7K_5782-t1 [Saitoella complicata NRRL Y-17804]|uniref:Uncharacterized protein n=1 Tax=Saitoella complicata (strain BCRC 22490 / CBS 7301 / JCM 7358 / NBRC 10748 / NRRL Y-17804) TaxID=698492 RepID=A0A0E9NPC8_SAICN|nr:hypothetical protein G7K_5782-t1 [Saitoella complicata NRRL Y-17804]